MTALVLGILGLLLFFVPLLPPLLAGFTVIAAVGAWRRGRRRGLAAIGLLLTAAALVAHVWLLRFGHLS